MCIFLQIIFAASNCDLILTTLITYYRVFCIRHHSKNTVPLHLTLSLSDILLTEGASDDPVLTGTVLPLFRSICFCSMELRRLRSPMIVSRTFARALLYVFVYLCVWNCVNCLYVNISRFLPLCCCCCCCCADLVQTLLLLLLLLLLCAHLLLRLGTVPCSRSILRLLLLLLLRARRYLLLLLLLVLALIPHT